MHYHALNYQYLKYQKMAEERNIYVPSGCMLGEYVSGQGCVILRCWIPRKGLISSYGPGIFTTYYSIAYTDHLNCCRPQQFLNANFVPHSRIIVAYNSSAPAIIRCTQQTMRVRTILQLKVYLHRTGTFILNNLFLFQHQLHTYDPSDLQSDSCASKLFLSTSPTADTLPIFRLYLVTCQSLS